MPKARAMARAGIFVRIMSLLSCYNFHMRGLFQLVATLALLVSPFSACTGPLRSEASPTPTLLAAASFEPSPIPPTAMPTTVTRIIATPQRAEAEPGGADITPERLSSAWKNASTAVSPGQRVHLPILVYHHIELVRPGASATLRGLSVSPAEFEKQMAYLAAHDYHTIYFSDLVFYFRDGHALPPNPIILTFDDGWVAQYTVAFPILKKYGFVGTFFSPTNWVDRTAGSVMSWQQIAEMSAAGMEFGSHTVTHYLMAPRTEAQNRYELLASRRLIEQYTARPVIALAYPGGSFTPNVVKVVSEADYGAAVSMLGGVEQSYGEIYTLRRTSIRYWDTVEMFAQKLR